MALPKLRSERHCGRGFAAPSYHALAYRSYEFMLQVAEGLLPWNAGEELLHRTARSLLENEDLSGVGQWKRIERQQMHDVALQLAGVVDGLPSGQREVLVLAHEGYSLRAIRRMLPGRASFSLADDLASGIRGVWNRASDLVRQLS